MSTIWSDKSPEITSKLREGGDDVICEISFKQIKRERECIEDVNNRKKERVNDNFKYIEIENLVLKTKTLLKE